MVLKVIRHDNPLWCKSTFHITEKKKFVLVLSSLTPVICCDHVMR